MSSISSKTLGEKIKEDLKEKGLNQSAIAKKMNVSKQVINQIDRRKYFDLEFLQKLKEVTGLDYTSHSSQISTYTEGANIEQNLESSKVNNSQSIEFLLSIKLKSDNDHITSIGELISKIKNEALRMGFSVV